MAPTIGQMPPSASLAEPRPRPLCAGVRWPRCLSEVPSVCVCTIPPACGQGIAGCLSSVRLESLPAGAVPCTTTSVRSDSLPPVQTELSSIAPLSYIGQLLQLPSGRREEAIEVVISCLLRLPCSCETSAPVRSSETTFGLARIFALGLSPCALRPSTCRRCLRCSSPSSHTTPALLPWPVARPQATRKSSQSFMRPSSRISKMPARPGRHGRRRSRPLPTS
jgi:hypothetical protein